MRKDKFLNEKDRTYYIGFFEEKIKELKTTDDRLDLTCKDISPCQVLEVMAAMGYYVKSKNILGNMEQEAWYTFVKPDAPSLIMYYSGFTFNMNISLESDIVEREVVIFDFFRDKRK